VKFSFIAKHWGIWPAGWLCEALGVSRGGFNAWLTRARRARNFLGSSANDGVWGFVQLYHADRIRSYICTGILTRGRCEVRTTHLSSHVDEEDLEVWSVGTLSSFL
jgi:hypothetical protein